MGKSRKAVMIIRYVDGNENKIVFSQPLDETNALKRIEEGLSANIVILEMEDRVLAIPVHQIKNIEISPPPEKLPQYALRNVRIVE